MSSLRRPLATFSPLAVIADLIRNLLMSEGVYTACLHIGCRPFGAVFSSHVMPTLACAWAGIYGCGMLVLIFLSAGVYTACLRDCCRPFGAVFSGHVMPTLACAWAGIYGCGMLVLVFLSEGFTPPASAIAVAPSGLCSAAMSCRCWHVCGRASMAAVCWY